MCTFLYWVMILLFPANYLLALNFHIRKTMIKTFGRFVLAHSRDWYAFCNQPFSKKISMVVQSPFPETHNANVFFRIFNLASPVPQTCMSATVVSFHWDPLCLSVYNCNLLSLILEYGIFPRSIYFATILFRLNRTRILNLLFKKILLLISLSICFLLAQKLQVRNYLI